MCWLGGMMNALIQKRGAVWLRLELNGLVGIDRKKKYILYILKPLMSLTIHISTWNVNTNCPVNVSLEPLLEHSETPPSIICIGIQEISSQVDAFYSNLTEKTSKNTKKLLFLLQKHIKMKFTTCEYKLITTQSSIALAIYTFVKDCYFEHINDVKIGILGTGLGNCNL